MGLRSNARAFAAMTAIGAAGCSSTATPRAQFLVVVDTDLPVASQIEGDPALSPDAAIDTVRVDAFTVGPPLAAFDVRTFTVPDASAWPLSFGVSAENAPRGASILLRVRAFRANLADPGRVLDQATLDPPAFTTIDRLVALTFPPDGEARVEVFLAGDCIGTPSLFGGSGTTCVDGAHTSAAPSDGLVALDAGAVVASKVGTWPAAREVPCAGTPPNGAVCVPGGFSILGDPAFRGVADLYSYDAYPPRAVVLSPFYLDRTEVTVKRMRALFAAGLAATPPHAKVPGDEALGFCTYQASGNDDLPVSCVTYATAAAACVALHGLLPSEAQWEHAARGRGEARLFPWGDQAATCCAASLSRQGPKDVPVECAASGSGIEPVGSHPARASCGGLGDVSKDGVLDLAGSLTEPTQDAFQPLDAPCWKDAERSGVPRDPVCVQDATQSHVGLGGYWNEGMALAALPYRRQFAEQSSTTGFRCAYPGAP